LRIERDVLISDAHVTAVGGHVPRLEVAVDLLLVDAELRQPLPRDFEEDDWLLSRDCQSSEQFAGLNRRYDEMQAEFALVPLTISETSQEEEL
jgi:hypothetical protein